MEHRDLVDLIRGGVSGRRWADLGAGTGAFTAALADLLGDGAEIVAVDKDRSALAGLETSLAGRRGLTLRVLHADFGQDLGLSGLDGVLMANSLHFLRDKASVLAQVSKMLVSGGTLLVVEYGADRGNPWVPHPFSYATWREMAAAAGFADTRLVGERPSRHLNSMYAAASRKP